MEAACFVNKRVCDQLNILFASSLDLGAEIERSLKILSVKRDNCGRKHGAVRGRGNDCMDYV